jgi:tetratricopeptide (TPR) repeat protein
VKVEADTKKLVAEGIHNTLRSEAHWDAPAWIEAAGYMMNNGNPDLALEYITRANEMTPTARGLRIKAALIEKKGDAEGAKALRAKAETMMAPEIAPVMSAYRLIGQKKYDEALTSLGQQTSWRGLVAIGDAWNGKGDKAKAMELYQKAMAAATNQSDRTEVQDSINALGAS